MAALIGQIGVRMQCPANCQADPDMVTTDEDQRVPRCDLRGPDHT